MIIAHEVGHLLLPQDSHSNGGIMRADLNLTSMLLLQEFTFRQRAAIKAGLTTGRQRRSNTRQPAADLKP